MISDYVKFPLEVKEVTLDWSSFVGSDTISTSSWSVPSGITNAGDTNNTTSTTIYLSGGTSGNQYAITNTITLTIDGAISTPRTVLVEVIPLG